MLLIRAPGWPVLTLKSKGYVRPDTGAFSRLLSKERGLLEIVRAGCCVCYLLVADCYINLNIRQSLTHERPLASSQPGPGRPRFLAEWSAGALPPMEDSPAEWFSTPSLPTYVSFDWLINSPSSRLPIPGTQHSASP
jgi:hypothetical protein